MFVGVLVIEIMIYSSTSLKEKRLVLKSMKDRLKNKFNVAVAEIGYQDKWQRASIGTCMISGDKYKLETDMARVRKLCEEMPRIEIVDINQEWL